MTPEAEAYLRSKQHAGEEARDMIRDESRNAPGDMNYSGASQAMNRMAGQGYQNMVTQAGGSPMAARAAQQSGRLGMSRASGMGQQADLQGQLAQVGLDATTLGEELAAMREIQLGNNRREQAWEQINSAGTIGNTQNQAGHDTAAIGLLGSWLSDPESKKNIYQAGAQDAIRSLATSRGIDFRPDFRRDR